MKQRKDYYQILGIDRTADARTIKAAYRKLAKQYHPDIGGEDPGTAEKFRQITEAYEVLSNPEKKNRYDAGEEEALFGEEGNPFEGFGGFSGRDSSYEYQRFSFDEENLQEDDFFDHMFGSMFGFDGQRYSEYRKNGYKETDGAYRRRSRGRDLKSEITVSLDEAFSGCRKVLRLQNPADGLSRTLEIQIPAGIEEGKCIRLGGQGNRGKNGGAAGDLLLTVHVTEKPGFERKGMDLYTGVTIPFTAAVLGGEITVETVDGKVCCSLKPGTQGGSRIRLKGKGMPSLKDPSVRGDQYVTVEIEVPKHLSPEAVKKLREFEKVCQGQRTRGMGAA